MIPATRLPDTCLVALFKQLPPADQMIARNLCRRWADLVTYAARSTRSLAILVGDQVMDKFEESANADSLGAIKVVALLKNEDGSPMFPLQRFSQWNALLYRGGLDEATVEEIAATFVNIKTLQVGLLDVFFYQLNAISHLLKLWAHQLTTLKVRKNLWTFGDGVDKSAVDTLFAAINGITTLKHLHLRLLNHPYHDLPIISQLEQLSFLMLRCSPRQFAAMLRQHATANTSLRSVEYLCGEFPNSAGQKELEELTSFDDHLLSCFTRIGFPRSPHTNSKLISTHFRHLTSLSIRPTDTTLRRLFDHLSRLTQLLHLHLYINFPSLLPDDQPHQLLPQLKSIKALQLTLTITSHRQLEQLKISWTMPNVEAIEFNFDWNSHCTDCTISGFSAHHIRANLTTTQHCYRQIFTPLKRTCTKLRAILHKREHILGSADDLLAE